MTADSLSHLRRPAAAEPEGLLVLFHGRGADERDLFPLLDVLDPDRRLLAVAPRGPLHLPPGGAHWYAVEEIGFPDPVTFAETFSIASSWLDAIGAGRPRPAGLIALSGFMPTVPGFALDLEPPFPRAAIGHGVLDPVISVDWSRDARARLTDAGADVTYHESPHMAHSIDPAFFRELPAWLAETLGVAA